MTQFEGPYLPGAGPLQGVRSSVSVRRLSVPQRWPGESAPTPLSQQQQALTPGDVECCWMLLVGVDVDDEWCVSSVVTSG